MNIAEKIYVTGLFILFTTVVVGGVFTSQVAVLWLRNKREERRNEARIRESERLDRFENERNAWYELAKDQNERIAKMSEELARITKNYENAKTLMGKVNLKEKGVETR